MSTTMSTRHPEMLINGVIIWCCDQNGTEGVVQQRSQQRRQRPSLQNSVFTSPAFIPPSCFSCLSFFCAKENKGSQSVRGGGQCPDSFLLPRHMKMMNI